MNIRISRLSMTNFKCFREKELNLDEDIITIRGRNGAGKTTIADAILFCLFGKNSEGQSDLELFKTRENGKVIPNLDHSVELVLETSAKDDATFEVILKRSIKEVWIKKRGSEESVFKNNTVEYFVNGESYTKSDYEKYITSLVDERVFRAITNPNYFPSLKWQDQRKFLTAMVGDIEPEEVANTEELAKLVMSLDDTNVDVEAYLKHLKYQIKQIKDKLDKIPVRLEEQNKALPEKLDWESLKAEKEKADADIKVLDQKIADLHNGNGADVKRKELTNQISETTVAIDKIRLKAQEECNKIKAEIQQQINQYSLKFNEELNNQKLMEQTIEADKRLIERCEQTMKECDGSLQVLREEWPTDKFTVDANIGICSMCGQPLPEEDKLYRIEKLRTMFNENKERKKRELNQKAADIKNIKADTEKELVSNKEKLQEDTQSLETIKETINTIFSEKAKLEKQQIPTIEQYLMNPEFAQYAALEKQLKELKSALDSVTDSVDTTEELAALEQQKSTYTERLSLTTQQLAMKMPYERCISLIEGIKAEQKDLVKQLSELEKKEDIARQYQFRQNQLLEERINKHFSLVQWKLFRTVNNGGDSFEEPFCECYVNGIPYHAGLNQACRLNAGLDICEALCRFYKVSAPIVIDNAESNLNIYQTTGQQIRLQVFDSELNLV